MSYQTSEPCTACGTEQAQRCLHHLKSQGAGGSDNDYNLMPLCLRCHNKVHLIGLSNFAQRNMGVVGWLLKNNWSVKMGRWIYHGQ